MSAKSICFLRRIFYGVILIALAVPVASPPRAVACACCSEPGLWYERSDQISDYEVEQVSRVKFSKKAEIYITDAGAPEGLEEIFPDSDLDYNVTQTRNGRRWEVKFKNREGKSGDLSFTIPSTIITFAADLHDGRESGGGGPLLYKEWRLKGAVDGAGVFKKSMAGKGEFQLILQGRGNSCTQAEDFRHWNLIITVPVGTYSFYGSLDDPASEPPQSQQRGPDTSQSSTPL